MNIPIIRIDIEGMKESIQYAFAVHSEEFNTMIHAAVDKAIDVDTIQAKIDKEVEKALHLSIESLSEHSLVKGIVRDIVVKSLANVRDEIEKEKT